jgi:tetratricopeptide (TPR) repeat protein
LGITYLKLKEFKKSIDILKVATTSHPNNFDAHFSIANSLSAFKNFSKAIKSYKKATTLNPMEGLTYVGLGLSLFGNGNSKNAIKALLKANKLFKEKKNISWHQDTRVMVAQIKHFAKFPPHFSNLWTTNNLKLVHETYEKGVFNSKRYTISSSKYEKNDFPIKVNN